MKVNRSNPFLVPLAKSRIARFTAASLIGTFSASAADVFWDIDGDVPGAGGVAPAGNWEDAKWSSSPAGDIETGNWLDGSDVVVFSAGTDATDPFSISTATPKVIGGLRVEEGAPTVSGTGSLEIISENTLFRINSAATISVPITGTGSGILKTGNGTLTLNRANAFDRSLRIEGGKVVIGGKMNLVVTGADSGKLSFGWNGGAGSSVQNLDIVEGADITVDKVALADWYYTENIVSHSGGTLNIVGTNDNGTAASFLMGHWGYGSNCVYGLSGGTLNSLGARLSLGWDRANVQFNQSGGTANLAGINLANGRNNRADYNLTGGRLNLGSGGINNASNKSINLGGATLGAFGNWTSTKQLTLTGGDLTINTLDSANETTERVISLNGGLSETLPTGIIKTGGGTLSLSGALSYTGNTQVNGGTLLPGANLTNSKIIVNAGGSVGGGSAVTPGISIVGDVDLKGGSLGFRVGSLSDQLDALTINVVTPSTVGVIPSQALTVGEEFTVVKYGALSGLGFAGLSAALPNPHYTASLIDDSANKQIKLKIDGADELIWTGANSGAWDVDTTANWKLASGLPGLVASKFYDFDVITFDDSSSVGAVTLSGVIKPADITVDNDVTNYSFTGAPIGGGASLTKLGMASLDLSGANSFSGFTDLQAGRVITSTGTSLGTGGTPVTLGLDVIVQATASYSFGRGFQLTGGGAELEINPGVTTTLTSPWKGGGTLTKSGEGTLRVQGYSGGNGFGNTGIIMEAGKLIMNTGAFNQNIGLPSITIEKDAELVIPTGTFHALGGAFTTSPVINLNGGIFAIGQEQYLDKINMTGGTIVADGSNPQIRADYAFELKTFAAAESAVINGVNFQRVNSNLLFDVEDGAAPQDLVFNGSFETGTNPITKTGAGLMVMQGTQAYTSATNVNGGTLFIQGDLANTLVTVADTATLTGGGSIAGPVTVLAGGTIAPGSAAGPMQTGSATVAGNYACQIDGTACDSLVVTGDLDLTGATLDLAVLAGGATAETYVVASYTGSLTGSFSTVNGLPAGYTVQHQAATKQIVLTTAPVNPYASWETLNGIAEAGSSFDSDGDGIANGIEFVIGGDPSGPGSDSSSLLPTVASDATFLIITYRRTDESADADPFVEYGSTLGSWVEAEAGIYGVVINETDDAFGEGIDRVEVKIPRALAIGKKLFARLRINIP